MSRELEGSAASRNTYIQSRLKNVIAIGLTAIGLSMALLGTVASSPTAAGPTWLDPESLSEADGSPVDQAQIGLDEAGNALAVWREKVGSVWRAKYTERSVGGRWSAPEYLVTDGGPGEDVQNLRLAVDEEGNAIVVWKSFIGLDEQIFETHRVPGGEWSDLQWISGVAEWSDIDFLQVAISGGNTAVAWWVNTPSAPARAPVRGSVVWAAVRYAGEAWSSGQSLSVSDTEGLIAVNGGVSINDAGYALVGLVQYDLDYVATVQVATYLPGGGSGWGQPLDSLSVGSGSAPEVAIDGEGNSVAMWTEWDPFDGSMHLKSADRTADDLHQTVHRSGWSDPVEISGGVLSILDTQIKVDGDGNAVAIWSQLEGQSRNIYAITRTVGGEWGPPTIVATAHEEGSGGLAANLQLAVNSAGDAVVVWVGQDDSDSSYTIYSSMRPFDPESDGGRRGWTEPVAAVAGISRRPGARIAMDLEGNSVTMWNDSIGVPIIRAAAYDVAEPLIDGLDVPATGTVGVPIDFSSSSKNTWGTTETSWSFGDGQEATGSSVTHTYTRPGVYPVQARVADLVGSASTDSHTITISQNGPDPGTDPPVAQIPADLPNPGAGSSNDEQQDVSLGSVSLRIRCLKNRRAGSKRKGATKRKKKKRRLVPCGKKSKLPRRVVVSLSSTAKTMVRVKVNRRVKKRIRGKRSRFANRTVLRRTLAAKKGRNSYVLPIKRRYARGRLTGKVYVAGTKSAKTIRIRL